MNTLYHKTHKKASSLSLSLSLLKDRKSGFTIVELLIVIVIIGILATISIVAYNNVNDKARESSAQSSAKQLTTKLLAYEVENGSLPNELNDIGIKDSGSTTYQYSVNNSSNPKTWCSTVTVGNKSSYTSNTQTSPKSGGCAGHGQGGVSAVTNLAVNPGAEGNTGWQNSGANPTGAWSTTVSRSGNRSKESHNTTPGTGLLSLYALGGADGYGLPVEQDSKVYAISLYFRSDVPHSGRISCNFRTQPDGTWGSATYSSYVSGSPGSWTRVTLSNCTAPAGADRMRVGASVIAASSQPANTSAWVDDLMVTEGTAFPEYADGSSPNWVWNGTANNSTSTGPAL